MSMLYLSIFVSILIILTKRVLFLFVFSPMIIMYGKLAQKREKSRVKIEDNFLESVLSVEKSTRNQFIELSINRYCAGFYRYYIRVVGTLVSMHFRMFFYRHVLLMKIGAKSVVYHNADIRSPFNIVLGEGVIIGDNAILDGRNGIDIGNNVNLSSNVSIWTEQHDHRDPWFSCNTVKKRTEIHDRAWIGPNTIILPNTLIGEGSVIAAGAVVVKKTDDYSIYPGIPAKRIGARTMNLKYVMDGTYMPFN